MIIGEDEIEKSSYVLRDMTTGEQRSLGEQGLIATLTNQKRET